MSASNKRFAQWQPCPLDPQHLAPWWPRGDEDDWFVQCKSCNREGYRRAVFSGCVVGNDKRVISRRNKEVLVSTSKRAVGKMGWSGNLRVYSSTNCRGDGSVMSARNKLDAKADRRVQRTLTELRRDCLDLMRDDIKHGACKACSRRTILWLPASLCEKYLLLAAAAIAASAQQRATSGDS